MCCVALAGSIMEHPTWDENGFTYSGEAEWVDFDTERGDVLLLELACEMALDEGGLEMRLR